MLDAHELARKQLERDRARTSRARAWAKTDLFAHKIERMSPSPLAFLRGAAPMFYEVLERVPALAEGPPGEGFIVGDLHIENFGAFRPDPEKGRAQEPRARRRLRRERLRRLHDRAVAIRLLRLTTSLILGGRELGANGPEALVARDARSSTRTRARSRRPHALPPAPRTVRALLARATTRDRRALLDARTETHKNSRRFVRGLGTRISRRRSHVTPRVRSTGTSTAHVGKKHHTLYEIEDMAFRVAGTGSLGCLRVAMLVRGKGKRHGEWVFDMKEEDALPSAVRARPEEFASRRPIASSAVFARA